MGYWLLILLALLGPLRASDEPDENELSPSDTLAIAREKLQRQHCVVMKALADDIEKCTEGRITCEEFIRRFNKAAPDGTWLTEATVSPDQTPSQHYKTMIGRRFVIELTIIFELDGPGYSKTRQFDKEFCNQFGALDGETMDADGTPKSGGPLSSELAFIETFKSRFDPPDLMGCPRGRDVGYELKMAIGFEVPPAMADISLPRPTIPTRSYPLWNSEESIASYADNAKLPPTKTLAIGGSEQIEFVLIPAGEFTMGTPPAPEIQIDTYEKQMFLGATLAVISALWLAVRVCIMVVQALLKRQRLTYSLLQWLTFVIIAGVGVIGTEHWWFTARTLERDQTEISAMARRLKYSDEKESPAHKVTITTPFYMSKYPITQEQYFQVTSQNRSIFKGKNLAADSISWNDAQRFCQELHRRGAVRLPTEAEWEFACRAGTSSAYYTGDDEADLARAGWHSANSVGSTHPVGTRTPNAFGLYDMHGNVRQWCEDVLAPYPDHAVFDPRNPGEGEHVLRGGSWHSAPKRCRSAYRSSCNAFGQYDVVGFRVVMDVE
jgi:formylglycine-generating enzyme required for sulfatase activity